MAMQDSMSPVLQSLRAAHDILLHSTVDLSFSDSVEEDIQTPAKKARTGTALPDGAASTADAGTFDVLLREVSDEKATGEREAIPATIAQVLDSILAGEASMGRNVAKRAS